MILKIQKIIKIIKINIETKKKKKKKKKIFFSNFFKINFIITLIYGL
jgi:glycopeptide antibiotics resistance protein